MKKGKKISSRSRAKRMFAIIAAVLSVVLAAGLIQVVRILYFPSANISREKYPVTGVDISSHNGDVDFDLLKSDSVSFVIIKASEGASFKDPKFAHNYDNAVREGLSVGAYHFFRFDINGTLQGVNFLQTIGDRAIDLPLAIDVEQHGNPQVNTEVVVRRLQDMVDYLESENRDIMIYTNMNGYNKIVRNNFADYPLWICRLMYAPSNDIDWHLWQISHTTLLSGVKGNVDYNVWNGTREQWLHWIGKQ